MEKYALAFEKLDEFFEEDDREALQRQIRDNETSLAAVVGRPTMCEECLSEIGGSRFREIYGWAGIDVDFDKKIFILNNQFFREDNIAMGIYKVEQKMRTIADWIYRSYDGEDHPYEQNAWNVLEISGDDDVDYCASFIYPIIDALKNVYRDLTI